MLYYEICDKEAFAYLFEKKCSDIVFQTLLAGNHQGCHTFSTTLANLGIILILVVVIVIIYFFKDLNTGRSIGFQWRLGDLVAQADKATGLLVPDAIRS